MTAVPSPANTAPALLAVDRLLAEASWSRPPPQRVTTTARLLWVASDALDGGGPSTPTDCRGPGVGAD